MNIYIKIFNFFFFCFLLNTSSYAWKASEEFNEYMMQLSCSLTSDHIGENATENSYQIGLTNSKQFVLVGSHQPDITPIKGMVYVDNNLPEQLHQLDLGFLSNWKSNDKSKLTSQLLSGNNLSVEITNKNNQNYSFKVSLKGFSEEYTKYNDCLAKAKGVEHRRKIDKLKKQIESYK